MSTIPESIRLLFEASIERDGDRYVVPIPEELVQNGSLDETELYRIALLDGATSTAASSGRPSSTQGSGSEQPSTQSTSTSTSSRSRPNAQSPPVSEGEIRSVTIETLGDQGDGLARVERGFIVIVSGTEPGDEVEVEITDVKETVAFAEPI
ncbi:TRAM domain-containing protein [Halobium salinum]|uniref:TRAM domain-containing protein n=1 Tax=Halobium salinum TaxID=1364940 RepID=A0ABD5P8P8_9EURY|nr:TRAM domain-containing protein [Halobium salinum]